MRKFIGGKWTKVLALVLAVCLMTSAAWASSGEGKDKTNKSKHVKTKLKDIKEHWAEREIEEMGARGLINGYEDLSFRPRNEVTQQEVLAMLVRAMGLEQEAAVQTSNRLEIKHRQQLAAWAGGYLAVAVDHGLVLPAELAAIIPNKPAKREQVAIYLARVLIWAKMDTLGRTGSVNFSDAGDITKELMAYVSPIYTWGLMLGDPERKFQPNKPVTRAEMAVILARLDALLENGQVAEQRVTGTLQVITTGQNPAVQIRKQDNSLVTVSVAEDATIYRDRKRVDLAELKVGDLVEAVVNADGEVTFITATAPNLIIQVEGVLKSVELQDRTLEVTQENGSNAVYELAAGVLVRLNGRTVALDHLEAGDRVKLSLRDGQAVKVEARRITTRVQGTVLSLTLGSSSLLTIRDSGGASVTYTVYADTEVKVNGRRAALADVQPGYRADLKLQGDRVVEISAQSIDEDEVEFEVEGTIVAVVIGTTTSIVIDSEDGRRVTYTLGAEVEIEIDDEDGTVGDIQPGQRVELEVRGNVVTKVEVD